MIFSKYYLVIDLMSSSTTRVYEYKLETILKIPTWQIKVTTLFLDRDQYTFSIYKHIDWLR